jgi:hypothetical protein
MPTIAPATPLSGKIQGCRSAMPRKMLNHCAESGHRRDAERAGIGERITQIALQRCAREAECAADHNAQPVRAAAAAPAESCDRSHPESSQDVPAEHDAPDTIDTIASTNTSVSSEGMIQRRAVIVRPAREKLRRWRRVHARARQPSSTIVGPEQYMKPRREIPALRVNLAQRAVLHDPRRLRAIRSRNFADEPTDRVVRRGAAPAASADVS